MSFLTNKRKSKKLLYIVSAVLIVIFAACAVYLGDFYRADTAAIETFCSVSVEETEKNKDGYLIFGDETAKNGFVFYPGGKVEYTAYMPLMHTLADQGFFCVLVKMPFNLAVFDTDAADGIQLQYPLVENWYIGGHSLGGAMASSFVAEKQDVYDGLVLLGAYSTADLSDTDLAVLSVFGSEDMVMNREKYDLNKQNLPADFAEIVIDGGCHAYFGMYGAQEGDGNPAITNEEQILITADSIAALVAEN